MITLANVSYTYPSAALPVIANLSLAINEGEFLVVCGPSGAGKSTFLRLLNGLVPHFYGGIVGGEVQVWGRSTRTHQPRDLVDLVGFVFQNPEAQFVVDVVEDELVFGMENLGVPPHIMRRRVEEVLDQLGIAHLRRRRVSTLSGGEQQRVAIAAVLATQPRALVLDEPTSQLDPHAAEEVLTALQKLNDDLGLTIVLCEHRLERVVQYADRLVYFGKEDERGREGEGEVSLLPLSPSPPLIGTPRDVLAQIELAPPLVRLGKKLGWEPLPLTIKEGRRWSIGVKNDLDVRGQGSGVRAANDATNQGAKDRQGDRETGKHGDKFILHPSSFIASRQPTTEAISLQHLHVLYGEHEALYDLSLTARAGEVLALMGRNGSGKTTLLKALVGLIKPQRGTIRVLGHDVVKMDVEDVATFVGYVPQDPRTLLFHDTLREELEFTLKNHPRGQGSGGRGRGGKETRRKGGEPSAASLQPLSPQSSVLSPRQQTNDTLAKFGLSHLAEAYPRDLSGGEAQRAALAAVLVAEPQVLLLDEPTRGLDYGAKDQLGRLLRQLAAAGRTIVVATHDVEMVAACADRVALLGDGELVVEGTAREILSGSLIFSPQIAKLFPNTGWLTVDDVGTDQLD